MTFIFLYHIFSTEFVGKDDCQTCLSLLGTQVTQNSLLSFSIHTGSGKTPNKCSVTLLVKLCITYHNRNHAPDQFYLQTRQHEIVVTLFIH